MQIAKLTLRWPSGIVEEHLFTHATYAHESYHLMTKNAPGASKPAFKVETIDVHENHVDLRATITRI